MNRQTASKYIGRTVLIDQGNDGVYFGTLQEVFTPPKKIWSGQVKIQGLAELPPIEHADVLPKMKHRNVVVPGSKIGFSTNNENTDYDSSVKEAVQAAVKELQSAVYDYSSRAEKWEEIHARFDGTASSSNDPASHQDQDETALYVYYRIQRRNGYPFLYEPVYGDELELEGCPFEFEIKMNGKWKTVSHNRNFSFTDSDGKTVNLKQNDYVRIHKEQFQPFTILLNELEHPARESLLNDIDYFGFTKDDLADCHNRLLYELLQSEGKSSFQGVNFLTFQSTGKTLLIQHHYERQLKSTEQDYVYDRFECTADYGERRISTYTSHYSKDHES